MTSKLEALVRRRLVLLLDSRFRSSNQDLMIIFGHSNWIDDQAFHHGGDGRFESRIRAGRDVLVSWDPVPLSALRSSLLARSFFARFGGLRTQTDLYHRFQARRLLGDPNPRAGSCIRSLREVIGGVRFAAQLRQRRAAGGRGGQAYGRPASKTIHSVGREGDRTLQLRGKEITDETRGG